MAAKITTGGKKAALLMVSPNALTAALSVFNGTGCSSVSPALVALMSLSVLAA